MIIRTLIALFLFLIAVVAIVWALGGGPQRAFSSARAIQNPLEFFMGKGVEGAPIMLPWQPETTRGPDIMFSGGGTDAYADPYATNDADSERDDLSPARKAMDFGDPSPYVGRVTLSRGGGTSDPAGEFIVIEANPSNGAPVFVSGWSLQSALSGVRMVIPQAAPLFVSGVVNAVAPVALVPGASAVVGSGISPVGVSFRENICTGYLGQFQDFVPPLDATRCPNPSEEVLPSCSPYVQNVPPCRFPSEADTRGATPACKAAIANALSYNGCVNARRADPGFALDSWRLYLVAGASLWRVHDRLRLLDGRGRVVDVVAY